MLLQPSSFPVEEHIYFKFCPWMCWDVDQIHPDRDTWSCFTLNRGVSWGRRRAPPKRLRNDMLVFLIIGLLEFSGKESESREAQSKCKWMFTWVFGGTLGLEYWCSGALQCAGSWFCRPGVGNCPSSSCSCLDREKWICSGLRASQSLFKPCCQSVDENTIMEKHLRSYKRSYRNGPSLSVVTV